MNNENLMLSVGIPMITLGGFVYYWYRKKYRQSNLIESAHLNINDMESYTRMNV